MLQRHITPFLILPILLFLCTLSSSVLSEPTERVEASTPQPLIHQSGKFRVIYYTEGIHAAAPEDTNGNNLPDQVEDALTQTMAAYYLFVETLGFPDPFQSFSFQGPKFLDITIRSQEVSVEEGGLGGQSGLAFAQSHPSPIPNDKGNETEQKTLSIGFRLSSSLQVSSNPTPARELFHLIQYGVTFFKNKWFTAGTARWAEYGLSKLDPNKATANLMIWPLSSEQVSSLYAMDKESADVFWTPLATKMNNRGVIPFTPALHKIMPLSYASDKPVFGSMRFPGWMFIRDVLLELGRVDDIAFLEMGYQEWTKENQASPKNNRYIMEAVNTVVTRYQAALRL